MQQAKLIAKLAGDKKADNIAILDLRKISNFCDYFIICEGESNVQIQAIAEHIADELTKRNIFIRALEGQNESGWILIDTTAVMVHIFTNEMRKFYDLERLWVDARRVKLS